MNRQKFFLLLSNYYPMEEDTFSLLRFSRIRLLNFALPLFFSFSSSFLSPRCLSAPRCPHSKAVLVRQFSLWTAGKVDGGFVLLVAVDVLEVYHHVQGVSQDKEQDQRRHQAHQDGRREEGGTVTC